MPCTWNTFLAISKPIVVICMWTAPSCDSVATITLWQFVAGSGRRPPHQNRTHAVQQRWRLQCITRSVGAGEQRGRHVEGKCLGSLQVDHQLEFSGLQHKQVAWLVPFENAADVVAPLAVEVCK